jgi:hypothetical protein
MVLEEVDGLARVAALEVGRAEPPGGTRLGDRVDRELDGSPAGRDGEIGIAHDRVDPTDRPRRVGLKPGLADGLGEGAHAVQDLEGGAEVSDVQQVEAEDAERLAQPPALPRSASSRAEPPGALGDALGGLLACARGLSRLDPARRSSRARGAAARRRWRRGGACRARAHRLDDDEGIAR